MDRTFFIAVKALLFYDGKFLLVKRSDRARDEHQYWELPGGRLEFGETPEQALTRELMEETGLSARIVSMLQTWNFFRGDDTQIVGITYLCEADSDHVQLSSEHDAFAWVFFDDLMKYSIFPPVLNDIEKLDFEEIASKLNRCK